MPGGERKGRKKRNVLIVAVKPSPTSRELLTWTLAKFTDPGDHVIALHVTPSPSEADSWRSKSASASRQISDIFDSVIGVYEGFCSIKQIDLQVKITYGTSLRKVLSEEAKNCNAARLILGNTSKQSTVRTSCAVAKYCTKQLPWTCSVLVIQHGCVVFEKQGSLVDENSKMRNSIQQPKRSQSCNVVHNHHAQGKCADSLNLYSDVQNEGCLVGYSSGYSRTEFDDEFHNWYLSSKHTNSPVSVLHSYKYVPPPLQGLKRFQNGGKMNSTSFSLVDTSRLQYTEETKILSAKKVNRDIHSSDCLDESPRRGSHQNNANQQFSQKNLQGPANIRQEKFVDRCSRDMKLEKFRRDAEAGESVSNSMTGQQQYETLNSNMPPGWPLLHRPISMNNAHTPRTRARGMSVVEWALQLPDRPKEALPQRTWLEDPTEADSSSLVNKVGISNSCYTEGEEHGERENSSKLILMNCNKSASPHNISRVIAMTKKANSVCQNKSCREFQLPELQAATNNFSKGNLVGKGGCSKVYHGVLSDGRVVAVKCLNAFATDSEQQFLTEIEIVSGLQHCHIAQLMGYCTDSQNYFLVYNFAPEGNLEQNLHAGKGKTTLPWNARYQIAVGVAKALHYLHNKCAAQVIHRDVKSSNVLLLSDLAPQLTDFGLAKLVPTTSTYITCSDVVGTFGYLAPEYFMYGKVNEKVDVYSFGVVLLELITGKHPIDTAKPRGQENLVVWARPLLEDESSYYQLVDPKLEGAYNADQLKNLAIAAALCVRQSPHARPRMSRILRVLTGECNNLEHLVRQDPVCKEMDEGFDVPNNGDCDIQSHFTLALLGLDDDVVSQASIDNSIDFAHSNNLEEYLRGRYSRTSSFE